VQQHLGIATVPLCRAQPALHILYVPSEKLQFSQKIKSAGKKKKRVVISTALLVEHPLPISWERTEIADLD